MLSRLDATKPTQKKDNINSPGAADRFAFVPNQPPR